MCFFLMGKCFFEALRVLFLSPRGLAIALKDRTTDSDPMRTVRRYPEHSPNAHRVLRLMVIGLMYKCIQYAFSATHAWENLRPVGKDLQAKGYPQSWWLGAAKTALRVQRLSLRAPAWAITETHGFLPCLLAAMAAPIVQ